MKSRDTCEISNFNTLQLRLLRLYRPNSLKMESQSSLIDTKIKISFVAFKMSIFQMNYGSKFEIKSNLLFKAACYMESEMDDLF